MQQQEMDWIEYIADKVYEHYKGRKVVLWGKYTESDNIKDKLEEKYQIETAFYVDNDDIKIDDMQVFSTDCLKGKSTEYYVVVPLAVYTSIRELLIKGGYKPELDYYYFSDCIVRQEEDYYEDAHGNKIVGRYTGIKFVFSGFDSVIEIGDNVKCREVSCYVHNNSKIKIGNNVKLLKTNYNIHNNSTMIIHDHVEVRETYIYLDNFVNVLLGKKVRLTGCKIHMLDSSRCEIQSECIFNYLAMTVGKCAEAMVNERIEHNAGARQISVWTLFDHSRLEIGCKGKFKYGLLQIGQNALLKIGNGFSVQWDYFFSIGQDSVVTIGMECMFSSNIVLQSNDGYSIFDVLTGENINSTLDIRKRRKIEIGNHVWVGMRAAILYNTTVGDGSIIGAMSMVKCKIPNNCIAAGVPARIVRRNIAWCGENGSGNIIECGKDYIHLTEERGNGYV